MAGRPRSVPSISSIEQSMHLPFLYQTRTILQAAARHTIRGGQKCPTFKTPNLSSVRNNIQKACYSERAGGGRSRGRGAVPFDEESISGAERDNRVNTASSVTAAEARIFQGLLGLQKRDDGPVTEESKDKPSLSSVVGEATGVSFGDDSISRIIQEYLADQKSRTTSLDSDLRDQDKSGGILRNVTDLMNGAQSDARLWQIFHEQVTDKVLALNLDDPDHEQSNLEERDRFLRTIQPSIGHFYEIMERNFPTSSYALALLPRLKELPLSTFAVMAGTKLYDSHLSLLYRQRLDLRSMFRLLHEMEANVIPFSKKTFDLLEGILDTAKYNQTRVWTSAGYFWKNESIKIALPKLKYWHDRVARETQQLAKRRKHDDQLVGFN